MEFKSHGTGTNSFENSSDTKESSDGTSKKTKKKPIGAAAVGRAEIDDIQIKKQNVERDLAKSLDKFSLFERPKDEPEAPAKNAEDAEESEAEAPLETLGEEEKTHLTQRIAEEHRKAIAETDEQTQAELQEADEFLELVVEGEDPEAAFRKVAAEMGMDEAEIAEALDEQDAEAEMPEPESEPDNYDNGEIDTSEDAEGEVPLTAGGFGGGRGGAGTPPPPGPTPPPAPMGGPAPGPGPGPGGPATYSAPTAARAPSMSNAAPERANAYYERRNNAGQLLLIGAIGYLIGRRRGRLRTERKLLPVQRKLEKQVTELEQDITRKEQKIVALKAERQPAIQQPEVRQPEVRQAATAPSPVERTQSSKQETRLHLQKPAGAERLGHMVVAAEAPAKIIEKTRLEKPNNIREAFRAEEVKDMRRADLLELSEKIKVEGASLRHIYESRLIGEKQLRHLVSEYLQGKDIRDDLRREMIEHEIDFERDPILRDRVRSMMTSEAGGQGLGALLTKAGITNDDQADPTIKRRMEQAEQKAAQDAQRKRRNRVLVESTMATVITVLAVTVAILLLTR